MQRGEVMTIIPELLNDIYWRVEQKEDRSELERAFDQLHGHIDPDAVDQIESEVNAFVAQIIEHAFVLGFEMARDPSPLLFKNGS
jgi:hypothetical protein